MAKELVGKRHGELVAWLRDEWLPKGHPVCILHGGSGAGKTAVAQELGRKLADGPMRVVRHDLPARRIDWFHQASTELIARLDEPYCSQALDRRTVPDGPKPATLLGRMLAEPILIIGDEFQHGLDAGGEPVKAMQGFIKQLNDRAENLPSRLLLLTNREPTRGGWSELGVDFKHLPEMNEEDGLAFLEHYLKKRSRDSRQVDVQENQRPKLVRWLGGVPRAIEIFVDILARGSSLDELVQLDYERWQADDPVVDKKLIEELERRMFAEKVFPGLAPELLTFVKRMSVFRRPVKKEAFVTIGYDKEFAGRATTDLLAAYHLEERRQGVYNLQPVLRTVALAKLGKNPDALRKAHDKASEHFTKHFDAERQVVRLAEPYVEARYHLHQADNKQMLAKVTSVYGSEIRRRVHLVTPVPTDGDELDERIAELSAFLQQGQTKDRPRRYHLARCLDRRGREGDAARALDHAGQAARGYGNKDVWLLYIELSAQCEPFEVWRAVLDEGIAEVPPEHGVVDLYRFGGELLERDRRIEEAIKLVKQGIDLPVPPEHSVVDLYRFGGWLHAKHGDPKDGYELMVEGLRRLPLGRFGRPRLAENLLLMCTAAESTEWLGERREAEGEQALRAPQRALADCLEYQLRGEWAKAAEAAAQGRKAAPHYLILASQQAFCHLAAEESEKAHQSLATFPRELRHGPDTANTWLACFIALRGERIEEAKQLYAVYTGQEPEQGSVPALEKELLRLWDAPMVPDQAAPDPAFYHRILPPSLTGLDAPVVRPPDGKPVLVRLLESAAEPPVPTAVDAYLPPSAEALARLTKKDHKTQLQRLIDALPKDFSFAYGPDDWTAFDKYDKPGRINEINICRYVFFERAKEYDRFHAMRKLNHALSGDELKQFYAAFSRDAVAQGSGTSTGWVSGSSRAYRKLRRDLLPFPDQGWRDRGEKNGTPEEEAIHKEEKLMDEKGIDTLLVALNQHGEDLSDVHKRALRESIEGGAINNEKHLREQIRECLNRAERS